MFFLVQLDLGICKAILRDIGMQFRQVVNQEIEAQKWGGKEGMLKVKCNKCPYSEFFWSVFSRIWNGYGDSRSKCGKILTTKTLSTGTFYAVLMSRGVFRSLSNNYDEGRCESS